jgi:hypothetical protein
MWQVWGRREMHTGLCWEKPERKRILGKPRRRYECNIKIDLKEIESVGVNWINLAQNVSLTKSKFSDSRIGGILH